MGLDALAAPATGLLRRRPLILQRAQQRGGLSGVRGQHVQRRAAQILGEELGQDAQGTGVDDGGDPGGALPVFAAGTQGGGEDGSHLIGPGGVGGVDARPQDERLNASGGGNDLGAGGQDEVLHAPGGGQAHHAGAGAHRAAGGQDGGAGVGLAAGPQADHAAGVLVVAGAGLANNAGQVVTQGAVDGAAGQGPARGRGQPEGDDFDDATQVPGRGQALASLEAGEGDGMVGGQDRATHCAVVDAGSAGQVDGDDSQRAAPRLPGGDERGDEGGGVRSQRPGGADAGEPVQDESAVDEECLDSGHGLGGVLAGSVVAAVAGAVNGDAVAAGLLQGDGMGVLGGEHGADRAAAVGEQTSSQEGVGPVVAAAD